MAASRRAFLVTLAAVASWRPDARAQSANAKRVVVLFSGTPEMDEPASAPFFLELRRAGWIEGRNITYERLYARGSREKVGELAKVAAAKRPDLIFAPTAFAAMSARKATTSIPIVFSTVSDPIVMGLVRSLARPGANATGTFQIQTDLVAKKLEILREAMPRVRRVGVVLEGAGQDRPVQTQSHADAGRRPGLELSIADFTKFDDIPSVLAKLKRDGAEVVTVGSSFTLIGRRKEFVEMTREARIPFVAHRVEWAEAGAVLSYGADVGDTLRRTAEIANRILNGASPTNTPVEQASKFELVVNLRAAKEHGLVLPKVLLARADRVIE